MSGKGCQAESALHGQWNGSNHSNHSSLSSWKNNVLFMFIVTWIIIFYVGSDIQDLPIQHTSHPTPMSLYYEEEEQQFNYSDDNAFAAAAAAAADVQPDKVKTILLFTPFFGMKDWAFGGFGREPFLKAKCPVSNCYITNDRNYNNGSVSDFDAVLFHMRNMNGGKVAVPNQSKRRREQVYVMFLVESPIHDNFPYQKFKGTFRWRIQLLRKQHWQISH